MGRVIDPHNVFVVYNDSHFVLVVAKSQEAAKNLDGKIIGHYQTSDLANEALNTMKTVSGLG
jgi:hypothetical protein